jgi:hypothetical protein
VLHGALANCSFQSQSPQHLQQRKRLVTLSITHKFPDAE